MTNYNNTNNRFKYYIIGVIALAIILGVCIMMLGGSKVEIKTSEEAIQRFENQDTFILVIGESWCENCQNYKDDTLTKYVKKYNQDDVVFLYITDSFANESEFYRFLETYGLAFDNSIPSTYYIKDGKFINSTQTKFEGYRTLEQLETFKSVNEASD